MLSDIPGLQKNIPLQDKNTFRIGGPAKYYLEPETEMELIDALRRARRSNIPLFILGKGSNVLISDKGWPGLVINLSARFTGITWNGSEVEVKGGTSLNQLTAESAASGKTGIEQLSGIPGTIAGAVVMNAGAFDSCIADTLSYVTYYDSGKDQIILSNASELALGYRTSIFRQISAVVLCAGFHLHIQMSKDQLCAVRKDILARRKQKQPLDYPNCGSVFKRPEGNFAGTMIEQCRLKGTSAGGVEISEKHANFIINKNNGTASDVRKLITTVQKTVYERFGILLETEVIFAGEFEESLFIPPDLA